MASLKGLLQQYKNTPIFESITKLIYFLEPKVAKEDSVLSSGRIIVSPQMEYDINVKNWDKINEALSKNRKIQGRYTKPYPNNEAKRLYGLSSLFLTTVLYIFLPTVNMRTQFFYMI